MANSIDSVVLSSVRNINTNTSKTDTKGESSDDRLDQAARLSATPDAIADQAAIVSLGGSSGSLTGVVNASIAVGGPDISGLQNKSEVPESVAGQEFQNIVRTATSSLGSDADSEATEAVEASDSTDSTGEVNVDDSQVEDIDTVDTGVVGEEGENDEEDDDDQGDDDQD